MAEDAKNDPLGLDAEFASASVTPEQLSNAAGTDIVKQFDLGDGPMEFRAATNDELIQQVIAAQNERFNRAIAAQQLAAQANEPQMPTLPTYEIPPISPEEEQLMAVNWAANPQGYTRRIIEANVHMPLEVLSEKLAALEIAEMKQYVRDAGAQFQYRHQDDYNPCDENAQMMVNYINANSLDFTPANYELAFTELKNAGMLRPVAPPTDEALNNSASTALSESASYGAQTQFGGGSNASEIERQAREMPLEQLRQLVFRRNA